jgi:hypothetical protein
MAAALLLLLFGSPVAAITLPSPPGHSVPGPGATWLMVLASFVVALPALLVFTWYLSADASGLTVRTFWHARRVPWSDVTDYYDVYKRDAGITAWIVTRKDKPISIPRQWVSGTDGLRQRIAGSATGSVHHGWALLGVRPIDTWPRSFDYGGFAAWWEFLRVTAFLCCFASAPFFGWPHFVRLVALMGPGVAFAMAALCILVLGAILAVMTRVSVMRFRALRRHVGETITIDTSSITISRPSEPARTYPWSAVSDYYVRRPGGPMGAQYVLGIRGSAEDEITSDAWIKEFYLLTEIVRRYAGSPTDRVRGAAAGWSTRGDDDAPGGAFVSPGGCTEYIYRYRNRSNAQRLLFATAFAAGIDALAGSLWVAGLYEADGTITLLLVLSAILSAPCLYGWWRYFAARIEIDAHGISQRTPFGTTRIPWFAVHDYYGVRWLGYEIGVVEARNHARIRFSTEISSPRSLVEEIKRRAPAPVTGWGKLRGRP